MKQSRLLALLAVFAAALPRTLASAAADPIAPIHVGDAGAVPRASGAPAEREKLAGPSLDSVLGEIAKARKSVRTMRANFTQERTLTLLAASVKSTGELALVAPDRLRWQLAPPDDIVYLIGPEGLSYKTRSSKATVPATGANIAKALTDLRALLGGDLTLLNERYVLTGSRGPDDVEIAGTAKDNTAAIRAFALTLDKTLLVPVKAKLIEGKRDSIAIAFSNAQMNVPVDPATMRP